MNFKKTATPEKSGVTLKSLAFHESGHAVVGWILNQKFEYVSIIEDERSGGHVKNRALNQTLLERFVNGEALNPVEERVFENVIMSFYAGPMAEARHLKSKSWFHYRSTDDESAIFFLVRLDDDPKVMKARLKYLQAKTNAMIYQNVYWDLIKVVASELLKKKKLTYRKFKQIVGQRVMQKANLAA